MLNHHKTGFTLIELLVVIAIISLLVSLLLPSLNKAKDLAKNVACMSSLRNVGYGATLYGSDNDGSAVLLTCDNNWGNEDTTVWYAVLARGEYTSAESFQCPAEDIKYDSNPIRDENGKAYWAEVNGDYYNKDLLSLGINFRCAQPNGVTKTPIYTIEQIAGMGNMSNAIYFGDSTPNGRADILTTGYYLERSSRVWPHLYHIWSPIAARHNEYRTANLAFFDGHVGATDADEIIDAPDKFFNANY